MKKVFIIPLFFVTLMACKKDKDATIEFINQTSCSYNIYDGVNSNSEFVGFIGANQTTDLSIEMDCGNCSVTGNYLYLEDVNCSGFDNASGQYTVDLDAGTTSTILIN